MAVTTDRVAEDLACRARRLEEVTAAVERDAALGRVDQVLVPRRLLVRDRAQHVVGQAPLAGAPLEDLVGRARELTVDSPEEPAVPPPVVAPARQWSLRERPMDGT